MADPIYDEVAAGRYLGGDDSPLSSRTMQRHRLEGTGPRFIRVGRLVRYRQSDLDAYIERCARQSTSED